MATDATRRPAPNLTAAELWAATLADLERNLPRPTFDTWLRATQPLSLVDATLTVVASTPYAHDWLNTRLKPTIERTAGRIADRPITVTFTTPDAPPKPQPTDYRPDAHARVFDFDPKSRGYQIVPAYAVKFWLPLLGAEAFATYQLLKAWYYNPHGHWTRWRPVYLTLIARTVGCHVQTLTGRRDYPGKLQLMCDEGIAKMRIVGATRDRHYYLAVLNDLPLLTPAQVARLPSLIRREHTTFLAMAQIDLQEWEQLELPPEAQFAANAAKPAPEQGG